MTLLRPALAAVILGLPAGQALAEGMTFTGLTYTSDYVVGGFSLNDGKPALQGYVEHNYDSGFYVGLWATQTDFGTPDRVEMDYYLGYRGAWQKLSYDVSYTAYVLDRTGFDYGEVIGRAAWNVSDNLALGGILRAPSGGVYEDEFLYGPSLSATLRPGTTIKGEYMFNTLDDLNDWNLSISQNVTDTVSVKLTQWHNEIEGSTLVAAISFDTDFATLFGR